MKHESIPENEINDAVFFKRKTYIITKPSDSSETKHKKGRSQKTYTTEV